MELWVSNNMMKLFSCLYIAASYTAHLHYFSCVCILLVVTLCITFLNMSPSIFFFFSLSFT